jgi:hypothetical protein
MVHGDCSSRGCYAMTDEQIAEIYSLGRESFFRRPAVVPVPGLSVPMTPVNMAKHRNNPNMPFWKMIKEGYDHFEVTRQEPKVEVCNRHYVFDATAAAESAKPIVFTPTARCPAFVVAPEIAEPVLEKAARRRIPIRPVGQSQRLPVAPIRTGLDGGMNRVFLAQVGGSIPPARVPAPGTLPPQRASVSAPASAAISSSPVVGSILCASIAGNCAGCCSGGCAMISTRISCAVTASRRRWLIASNR